MSSQFVIDIVCTTDIADTAFRNLLASLTLSDNYVACFAKLVQLMHEVRVLYIYIYLCAYRVDGNGC